MFTIDEGTAERLRSHFGDRATLNIVKIQENGPEAYAAYFPEFEVVGITGEKLEIPIVGRGKSRISASRDFIRQVSDREMFIRLLCTDCDSARKAEVNTFSCTSISGNGRHP